MLINADKSGVGRELIEIVMYACMRLSVWLAVCQRHPDQHDLLTVPGISAIESLLLACWPSSMCSNSPPNEKGDGCLAHI